MMIRFIIHYFLHLVFPGFISLAFYREQWKKVYLVFLLTMIADLDHLLANPIYDPNRCSIGFHFLHSYVAIIFYFGLLFIAGTRIIAIGLLLHIATDYFDCILKQHSL